MGRKAKMKKYAILFVKSSKNLFCPQKIQNSRPSVREYKKFWVKKKADFTEEFETKKMFLYRIKIERDSKGTLLGII